MDRIAEIVEDFIRKILGLEHSVARGVAGFQKAIDVLQKAEDKANAKMQRLDAKLNAIADKKNIQSLEAQEAGRLAVKFTEFLAK